MNKAAWLRQVRGHASGGRLKSEREVEGGAREDQYGAALRLIEATAARLMAQFASNLGAQIAGPPGARRPFAHFASPGMKSEPSKLG